MKTVITVIIIAETALSLAVLANLVWSLIVLAWTLVVLVYPLIASLCQLVVLVCPFVVLVCPLVVPVVLSVYLLITDLKRDSNTVIFLCILRNFQEQLF